MCQYQLIELFFQKCIAKAPLDLAKFVNCIKVKLKGCIEGAFQSKKKMVER